jgi:hypothetical protein
MMPKLPAADDDYTPQQRRTTDARLTESEEDLKKPDIFSDDSTAADSGVDDGVQTHR